MLRLISITDLDFVIDECQIGVMSTSCYSLTDAISDRMFIVCASILSRCLSSWLMDIHTVGHSAGFECGLFAAYKSCHWVNEYL